MADGSITFDIELLDKRAKERLEELNNLVENTGETMDDEMANKAYKFISDWGEASTKYESVIAKMKDVTEELKDSMESLEVDKAYGDNEGVRNLTAHISNLKEEQEKLSYTAEKYAIKMDSVGIKASSLSDKIAEANNEQLGLNSLVSEHNNMVDSNLAQESVIVDKVSAKKRVMDAIVSNTRNAKEHLKGWVSNLKQSHDQATRVKSSTSAIGTSFKSSLKSLLRLSMAMLGMRGIITGLNKITREWYNSNDMAAKQAQANMQAMTSGIANLLAPALTLVTNLMATLFGYINAISKAFFGVDLLANRTSKSMGSSAGSAKKTEKAMKGWLGTFDDIDVASGNLADNMDDIGGGGGGGAIDIEPNIKTPDLSGFKKMLEDAFAPFIATLKSIDFGPLEKSFQNLARVGKESMGVLGGSIVRMTNDTLGPFIKLMAEDIVPRGINTFARSLERMNPVVDRLLKTFIEPLFGWLMLKFVPAGLDLAFAAFEALAGILTVVIESFNVFWDSAVGRVVAFVGGELILAIMQDLTNIFQEIVDSVDFFFEKLEAGDPIAQAIAFALGLIVTALLGWAAAMVLINAATAIFNAISPFGWVVIAVTAVIAIILVLYKNWENIVNFFKESLANIGKWFAEKGQAIKDGFDSVVRGMFDKWDNLVGKFYEGWHGFLQKGSDAIKSIGEFFGNMKENVVNYIKSIGTFWSNIINGMTEGVRNKIESIKGFFSNLLGYIGGAFKSGWSSAWNGVVNVFGNIVSGIANIFKAPINAMIDGINVFIRGINRIKIPSWVPGIGGAGFSIGQLPRLANGAVLTHQTAAVMAEYPNARTNPELVTPESKFKEILSEELASLKGGSNEPTTVITKIYLDGKQIHEVINKVEKQDAFNMNGGGLVWST